jgi:hypothetical protein
MLSPEQLADLRRAVLAAFDRITCPTEPDIAPHQCEECGAVRAAFAGVDWRAVPAATIEEHYGALPLFSPEAYPYFLGAWLLYALDHFTSDAEPTEFLVYDLAPNVPAPDDEGTIEWRRHRLRYLTREQLEVAERFLDAAEADPRLLRYCHDIAPGRAHYRESWERRWDS